MYQNRKTIVFILSALFQQSTLGTNSFAPKAQVNLKVTSPTKIITRRNDISHGSIDTPKRDSLEKYLSHGSITSPTSVEDPEITLSQRKVSSPTKTDNSDDNISYGSIILPNKLNKTEIDISQERLTLIAVRDDPVNYQSHKTITLATKLDTLIDHIHEKLASPTKTDNTANNISHGTVTLSIKTDILQTDLQDSGLTNRRQNPGQYKPFRPPSDSEIFRLLNEYQGIIKKYVPRNLEAFSQKSNYGSQNQSGVRWRGNNTIQLYQRGPHHTPQRHRKNSKYTNIARQDLFLNETETPDIDLDVETTTDDGWRPGMPPRTKNPNEQQKQVTQNEAQGAASRFTTRTTTTRRRRRTTPERVSFKEECDYIAYYCLKAYDTGKVCARTLYFIHQTFTNYCLVDYVNCMERYDTWQIAHMGPCFELKVLTEYLHYPYNDDYFLDNYYIVEDM